MIVFITGASAGFGAAMARTFVKNGHQVVLAARRKERLESLARELGESALPVAMDVTDKASIEEALSMLPQSWRQIDVLINNAGLALNTKPAHEVPLEDWDTMIATNVKGLVTMTHAVLPSMVERGSGLVINLGSVAGHYPYPGGNVYGATKASNVRLKGDDTAAAKVYEGTQPLTAEDIAETAYWIATLPPHVNINLIEMMPTCQGFSPFNIKRT